MKNGRDELYDSLIREAVKDEIESIDAPSTALAWRKVESQVAITRPSSASPFRFNWSRAAAVAAACLVIAMGGFGLFRNLQSTIPVADSYEPSAAAEEVGTLAFEDEDEAEETFALETDESPGLPDTLPEQVVARSAPDPSPPDWSETLDGDYSFGQALLLPEAEAPLYRGAIYYSDDVDLLLVKSKGAATSMQVFLDQLEEYMHLSLENVREINGFVSFTVEERPGLAWKENGYGQALLVLNGHLLEDELTKIASGINH